MPFVNASSSSCKRRDDSFSVDVFEDNARKDGGNAESSFDRFPKTPYTKTAYF
jgi:hypothetical protein